MKRKLLLVLPFALLGISLWLADGMDPFAHLKVSSQSTARILVDISGEASVLSQDLVCIQDTLKHHAEDIIGGDNNTRNMRLGIDLAQLGDSQNKSTDTAYRLKMDFIKVGIDEEFMQILAQLEARGLQVYDLNENDGSLTAKMAGSLEHPSHPGELVTFPEASLRLKWTSLGKTYVHT